MFSVLFCVGFFWLVGFWFAPPPPKWWSLLSYGTLCFCWIMERLLFCLEYFLKRFLERKGLSFTVLLRNRFILSLCPIFICLVSLLWPLCYSGVSDCCTLGFCGCHMVLVIWTIFSLLIWFWVWIQKLSVGKSTVIQLLTWNSSELLFCHLFYIYYSFVFSSCFPDLTWINSHLR